MIPPPRHPLRMSLSILGLLLMFFLAMNSLVDDSPTMDEQNHLGRGAAFAHTGDPRLNVEHPTLINGLSGAMLWLVPDLALPTDRPSWNREPPELFWYLFGEQFLWEYNVQQFYRLIFLGRLPILFLTMLMGCVAYRVAQQTWGGWSGTIALFAILFDPNILAHGRYVTTDLGGTAMIFLATAVLVHRWKMPLNGRDGWRSLGLLGLVMGLAFSSKLLALAFVPIWTVMALLPLHGTDWRSNLWRAVHLWAAGFVSIFVVWGLFAFEWGPFLFLSDQLAWLNAYSGPMPTFWSGIERIAFLTGGGRATFLLGELSTDGFLFYFPIAFWVKTPLWVLALLMTAIIVLILRVTTRQRALIWLIPAVLYFGISMTSALNIGYRHLLPILPMIYILISGLFGRDDPLRLSRFAMPIRRNLALASILFFMIPTLWIAPHYLSYFNLAGGGPDQGHHILIDSNIDWGQDLGRLSRWMEVNGVESVKLSWFGTADPAQYGINYEPLPGLPRHFELWWAVPFDSAEPEPGIYVISASNLWELPLEEKTVFAWFREREPDEKVGYSLFVYVVE